jgi:hypothetical protein
MQTTPFYRRDLSIWEFYWIQGDLSHSPHQYHRMTVLSFGAFELVFGAEKARNWLSWCLCGFVICKLHDVIAPPRYVGKVCMTMLHNSWGPRALARQEETACELMQSSCERPLLYAQPQDRTVCQTGGVLSFLDPATLMCHVYLVVLAHCSGRMIF